MKRSVWRNPFFLIGFTFMILMLVSSFVYSIVWGNEVRRLYFLSVEGKVVESSPISPKWSFPFGTDALGLDMLGKIIIGAKYTILTALVIAFLRVFLAIPLGLILGTFLMKYKKYINGWIDSFHYIPLTILAYFLLFPVLWEPFEGFSTSIVERFVIEILILSLLIVPILSALLGNEVSLLYKQEFIMSAKTLGAGRWRIIFKHILPSMKEKLVILLGQQFMQTLIIFIHLGLLTLFLGGTDVDYQLVNDPPRSITYEWSGLIGDSFRYLQGAPWIPLTPILFFSATMLSVSLMIEGYVQVTSGQSHYKKKFRSAYRPLTEKEGEHLKESDFQKVNM
ncbi:peptide ABC transporter permease [Bacillus sp. AFS015802]|uniref:ABC transporter permease n=1 Tax=Bacillus sp. AFS015802 TaxID=2033486 RepID=UPI000BF8AB7D|nr:ABC transporter permease subunit [Bacillus sp. AFS015802]PFA70482.1 peptide ABC transporter permease [Bacillus sp. AFS015802]